MTFEDLAGRRDLADAEATRAINILGPIRLTIRYYRAKALNFLVDAAYGD